MRTYFLDKLKSLKNEITAPAGPNKMVNAAIENESENRLQGIKRKIKKKNIQLTRESESRYIVSEHIGPNWIAIEREQIISISVGSK